MCEFCGHQALSKLQLKHHLKTCAVKKEADSRPVNCPHCDKRCKNAKGLAVHLRACKSNPNIVRAPPLILPPPSTSTTICPQQHEQRTPSPAVHHSGKRGRGDGTPTKPASTSKAKQVMPPLEDLFLFDNMEEEEED
eukprot:6488404-Amphidinium_carterae.1